MSPPKPRRSGRLAMVGWPDIAHARVFAAEENAELVKAYAYAEWCATRFAINTAIIWRWRRISEMILIAARAGIDAATTARLKIWPVIICCFYLKEKKGIEHKEED
jgi:hypothetical protein